MFYLMRHAQNQHLEKGIICPLSMVSNHSQGRPYQMDTHLFHIFSLKICTVDLVICTNTRGHTSLDQPFYSCQAI